MEDIKNINNSDITNQSFEFKPLPENPKSNIFKNLFFLLLGSFITIFIFFILFVITTYRLKSIIKTTVSNPSIVPTQAAVISPIPSVVSPIIKHQVNPLILNYEGWDKKADQAYFWFPKNNIVISKNINNYYSFTYKDTPIFSVPLTKDVVEKTILDKKSQVLNPINSLKEQGYVLNNSLSGLFNTGVNMMTPYFLQTYQKNNQTCQLLLVLECFEGNCTADNPNFGCLDLDINKAFSEQNIYYQALAKNPEYKNGFGYSEGIVNVAINSLGYKQISLSAWVDGEAAILDKNDKFVCGGHGCCDENNKTDPIMWNNDWCLNNYQPVDTYKSQN